MLGINKQNKNNLWSSLKSCNCNSFRPPYLCSRSYVTQYCFTFRNMSHNFVFYVYTRFDIMYSLSFDIYVKKIVFIFRNMWHNVVYIFKNIPHNVTFTFIRNVTKYVFYLQKNITQLCLYLMICFVEVCLFIPNYIKMIVVKFSI